MSERIEIHPLTVTASSPSAAASASTNCSFDLADLDPALILAAERGLAIAPVLTHSWHTSPVLSFQNSAAKLTSLPKLRPVFRAVTGPLIWVLPTWW